MIASKLATSAFKLNLKPQYLNVKKIAKFNFDNSKL